MHHTLTHLKKFWLPFPGLSLLNLRPNNKATSKPYASPICKLEMSAQGLHKDFNSPLPQSLWRSEKDAPPLIVASASLTDQWKREKEASCTCLDAMCPIFFSLSQHCLDSCAAGGLCLTPHKVWYPVLFKTNGTCTSALWRVARIAQPVCKYVPKICCSTICLFAWWSRCRPVPQQGTSPSLCLNKGSVFPFRSA